MSDFVFSRVIINCQVSNSAFSASSADVAGTVALTIQAPQDIPSLTDDLQGGIKVSTSKSTVDTPSKAQVAIQGLDSQIKSGSIARKLWDEVLNDQQRVKLGGKWRTAYLDGGPAAMWMRLHGVSYPRAILEVAREVGLINDREYERLLRETGTPQSRIEDTIMQAISSNDLVLVEHKRQVFWKGKLINIAWDKQQRFWRFFWKLCAKAKNGRAVNSKDFDVGLVSKSRNYPTTTKSALIKHRNFPPDLKTFMISVGEKSQKLTLAPERIRLFQERD